MDGEILYWDPTNACNRIWIKVDIITAWERKQELNIKIEEYKNFIQYYLNHSFTIDYQDLIISQP